MRCPVDGRVRSIVLRFNEEIQVDTFMLLNLEQYSTNVKHFAVFVS